MNAVLPNNVRCRTNMSRRDIDSSALIGQHFSIRRRKETITCTQYAGGQDEYDYHID